MVFPAELLLYSLKCVILMQIESRLFYSFRFDMEAHNDGLVWHSHRPVSLSNSDVIKYGRQHTEPAASNTNLDNKYPHNALDKDAKKRQPNNDTCNFFL